MNTTAFNRMCGDLSRALNAASLAEVVDYEAERALEKALKDTPAASVAKIRARADNAEFVTYDVGNGLHTYFLGNHYPDPIWAKIQQRRKQGLQRALKARGLSKQAFAQLAAAAGLKIKRRAFVDKATPRTGKTYNNSRAQRSHGRNTYGLTLSSTMPTLGTRYIAGQRRMDAALHGRVKYLQQNLKRKVFQSAVNIAKRYPGIRVTP